jgi:NADH-quinone oxidoreductase subunit J
MLHALEPYLRADVLLFAHFAVGALLTAIMLVLHPNPMRAALFLVLNLFCVAVLYLVLNAWFLASVQVLVYAGAIMVLFLFVIMLLNLGTPDLTRDRLRWQQPVAVFGGLMLAGLIGGTVLAGIQVPDVALSAMRTTENQEIGTVERIGTDLFNPSLPWLFPFEVTSVLLLVAVIGAVVLAKRRIRLDEE